MSKSKNGSPEMRLPDLSRSDDLSHPINRLLGIDNYCNVLLDNYASSSQKMWKHEDHCAESFSLMQKGFISEEMWKHTARLMQQYVNSCENWHKFFSQLTEAMRRAMPEVLLSCEIIRLYPPQLHKHRDTDWKSFATELKRVQLEARRLLDQISIQGSLPSSNLFQSEHDEQDGEWSDPMSLKKISSAIKQTEENAKKILRRTGLIQKTRQNWIVRIDTLRTDWSDAILAIRKDPKRRKSKRK
jgi:hypothetical protein